MSIKRAFILGAGFSKQAGLPLANELTELVINSEEIEEVDDIILTFNYDTVLEQSIDSVGKSWTNGLSDKEEGSIDILKMHGSINWLVLLQRPETDLSKFIKLYSKKNVDVSEHGHKPPDEQESAKELWRSKTHDACNSLLDMDRTGLINFPYEIGIAGLGRYKPLHQLVGTGPTWNEAFKALEEAEDIFVIGFSLSPYDTMASFHFR